MACSQQVSQFITEKFSSEVFHTWPWRDNSLAGFSTYTSPHLPLLQNLSLKTFVCSWSKHSSYSLSFWRSNPSMQSGFAPYFQQLSSIWQLRTKHPLIKVVFWNRCITAITTRILMLWSNQNWLSNSSKYYFTAFCCNIS